MPQITKFTVYVGSNNETHRLDSQDLKIQILANQILESYTIVEAQGCYKGQSEEARMIIVLRPAEDEHIIKKFTLAVKKALKQEDVIYTKEQVEFYSTSQEQYI